jgi:CheY-like chemotaxis protein
MSDSNKKVLIADDNEVSFAYLEVLLKRMGFISIHVKNGVELLKVIKHEKPDFILLDIGMGTMDGLTALEAVKKDNKTSYIPVIMVSGDDSRETIAKCRRLGCIGYLIKPVSSDKLQEALELKDWR